MQAIMKRLRAEPPQNIGEHRVTAVSDYLSLERKDLVAGHTSPIDCVAGNVIVLEFDGEPRCRITVRPSGTEPKLKFYTQWYDAVGENIEAQYLALEQRLEGLGRELEGLVLGH